MNVEREAMELSKADRLELIRDRARDFPAIHDPARFTSARVWHCKYRTLAPLSAFVGLTSLEIATYPDDSLEPLASLRELRLLQILHMPHVSDLSPLARLVRLRHLSLATLPSWDSSGKVTIVRSLAPLADLPVLERLELYGVRPSHGRVDDLIRSRSLREARLSKFPRFEVQRLGAALSSRPGALT